MLFKFYLLSSSAKQFHLKTPFNQHIMMQFDGQKFQLKLGQDSALSMHAMTKMTHVR